jgi:hypothetical protein
VPRNDNSSDVFLFKFVYLVFDISKKTGDENSKFSSPVFLFKQVFYAAAIA